jgi:mRNA interferase RelE/StbE
MDVTLSPKAVKALEQINEPMKSRINDALAGLEQNPPRGDIKKLAGQNGCRLRIGDYRATFTIENDTVIIANIKPRGAAYKRS